MNRGSGKLDGGGEFKNAPPAHFPGCCFALLGALLDCAGAAGAVCLWPTAKGLTAVALLALAAAIFAWGPGCCDIFFFPPFPDGAGAATRLSLTTWFPFCQKQQERHQEQIPIRREATFPSDDGLPL